MAELDPPPHCFLLDLTAPPMATAGDSPQVREENLPIKAAVCTGMKDPVRACPSSRDVTPRPLFRAHRLSIRSSVSALKIRFSSGCL